LDFLLDTYSDRFEIYKAEQLPFHFSNRNELEELIFNVYNFSQKELFTKEDIYNCLRAFAYKYGIVINGNDVTKWLKDRKL
jgi:hypothetical protein